MLKIENEKERESVQKFQERVGDVLQTLNTITHEPAEVISLRFLRARDYDLDRAENMIRKSAQWRVDKNIASYLHWKPPKMFEEGLLFRCTGYDNEGRPVVWVPLGKWDGRGLIEKGHKEDLIKYAYFIFESLYDFARKANASQVGALFALEELTMWKIASVETMQTLFGCLQDLAHNYPECMKYIMVINAPWIFSIAFNFIKPIMTARSMAKMSVFNSDKTKWKPALLNLMPEKSLPVEYLDN